MQMSSVLKTLESKALVERERCPRDPRAKRVTLTPAAVALLGQALPSTKTLQTTFFGADPAFGADLHTRLRQVVAGWGEDD